MLRSMLQLVANVATRCKCCNVVVRCAGMCVPAGLFMPTMFVGAKFGGATGFGVYWFLEHVAGQSALAQTIQPVQPTYLQCAVAPITSACSAQTCGRARLHHGCCAS